MAYVHNKRWREKNPDARKAQRKRYYDKTSNALRSGAPWTIEEDAAIFARKMTDMELAAKLGRSVAAIQTRRTKKLNGT